MSRVRTNRLTNVTAGSGVTIDDPRFASGPWVDVTSADYGADPTATDDSLAAFEAARDDLVTAGGGILYIPQGSYKLSDTFALAPTSAYSIEIRGDGTRHTFIRGGTAGMTVIRTGAETPDDAGTTTNAHYYGRITDLTILAATATDGKGLLMVEPHRWVVRNVNIEGFNAAGGTGLHLLGATTSGGIGAAASPHAWRNEFYSVQVTTTRRPLIIENGDENGFFGCNFNLPTGISTTADSLIAVEIIQGRNNRFFSTLLGGHSVAEATREAYVGVKFVQPVNGDVLGNVFYGLVAEGFNKPIWFDGAAAVANGVHDYNSSINAVEFQDDTPQQGTRCFVDAPYHHLNYRNTRAPYSDAITWASADATPSVSFGNVFATNNGSATTITAFDDGENGQTIWVRLDANTTIEHGTFLRCSGAANITGAAHMMVCFVSVGGVWYQAGPTVTDA